MWLILLILAVFLIILFAEDIQKSMEALALVVIAVLAIGICGGALFFILGQLHG